VTDQRGRRRFPVGTCDADQPHPIGRVAVPDTSGDEGGTLRVAHQDFRNAIGDVTLDDRQRASLEISDDDIDVPSFLKD